MRTHSRAANNFSFLKGHMSDQSPFWSDKAELWLHVFFPSIILLSGSLFEMIISHHYLLNIW